VTADAREVYRHYDGAHTFAIRRNFPEKPPLAIVDCDPDGSGETAFVPPHEVPKAARALYEAAGLDVPDLPDIPDPEEVEDIARVIHYALQGTTGCGAVDRQYARVLIAHGIGRVNT
jgi:hypothetical protein